MKLRADQPPPHSRISQIHKFELTNTQKKLFPTPELFVCWSAAALCFSGGGIQSHIMDVYQSGLDDDEICLGKPHKPQINFSPKSNIYKYFETQKNYTAKI